MTPTELGPVRFKREIDVKVDGIWVTAQVSAAINGLRERREQNDVSEVKTRTWVWRADCKVGWGSFKGRGVEGDLRLALTLGEKEYKEWKGMSESQSGRGGKGQGLG